MRYQMLLRMEAKSSILSPSAARITDSNSNRSVDVPPKGPSMKTDGRSLRMVGSTSNLLGW